MTKVANQKNIDYLNGVLNPIFEPLTLRILSDKPANIVDFIINWLLENADGDKTPTIKKLLASSSRSVSEVKLSNVKITEKESESVDENKSSESEEDDDEIEDLPKVLPQKARGPRASVSSEAYGAFNKKADYKPQVIPKSEDQKARISKRLEQSFMFSALEQKEKKIVIDAMEEKTFEAGKYVIRQGDEGNELYVVDVGELDCHKVFVKGGEDKYLKTYVPGESFGELALLYNVPRAASIKAKTRSVLYALSRECFNHIVRDSAARKREKYEGVLQKVQLLQTMDIYERSKVADGLKSVKFKKGDYVIRQGEAGDTFYMIESGTAVATKSSKPNGEEQQVFSYKAGDYFGELALLKDAPRAANIIATSELNLVVLEREAFKRLLGPLDLILKRNMEQYVKYQ